MELDNLPKIILVIVLSAMLLGVGVLSLDKFGDAVKVSAGVTDETIVISGGTGTTSHDEVTAITAFSNLTGEAIADLTDNITSLNWTEETGVIFVEPTNFPDGVDYLINYTYDSDSAGTDAMDSSLSAVSPIASVWIPLIVTIAALAIILVLVIKSFGGQRR